MRLALTPPARAVRAVCFGTAVTAVAAGAVVAAPAAGAAAIDTSDFHVSWFRPLPEITDARMTTTVTVPRVTCTGTAEPLEVIAGLTGRIVDRAAAVHGAVVVECAGGVATYYAEPWLGYASAGVGRLTVRPGDAVRVVVTNSRAGSAATLTLARTGQSIGVQGSTITVNGAVLEGETEDVARFSPVRFSGSTVNGGVFGTSEARRTNQTQDGTVIAAATGFTDGGRSTAFVDRR